MCLFWSPTFLFNIGCLSEALKLSVSILAGTILLLPHSEKICRGLLNSHSALCCELQTGVAKRTWSGLCGFWKPSCPWSQRCPLFDTNVTILAVVHGPRQRKETKAYPRSQGSSSKASTTTSWWKRRWIENSTKTPHFHQSGTAPNASLRTQFQNLTVVFLYSVWATHLELLDW